jgi:hypothetical protein
MRVFSAGLQLSVYPWAEAGPLKEPRSRWTGIPRYPEHRQVSPGTQREVGKGNHDASGKEWDHLRAAPCRCQASQQGFLPKNLSTTIRRSIAQEPREVETSTPPNSPSANMRHYVYEVAIIVSPRLPSRACKTKAKSSLHQGQ